MKKKFFTSDDGKLKLNYEELVDRVIQDYDKGDLGGRKKYYENSLKQYRGELPEKTKPWKGCSNVNVPVTEIVVDTYHANLMDSFFGGYDIVDIKPVSANDVDTAAKRKQFLNWQLVNEIDLQKVIDKVIEISLIYGDCFIKLRYARDVQIKKEVSIQTVIDENGQPVEQEIENEIEDVLYDAPKIDVPLPDEIILSPDATGLQKQDCRYIIHRVDITKADYIDRVNNHGYTDIDFTESKSKDIKQLYQHIRQQLKDYEQTMYDMQEEDNRVTLVEWHGSYFNEAESEYQEICAIINPASRTVCTAWKNELGFRPFVRFCPFPVAGRPYGRSLSEKLNPLQAQMNTIYNQRNDSAAMRIAAPFFYTAGSDFDPTRFNVEPNGGYPVDNVNNIKWYDGPGAPNSSYNEEQALWNYIDQLMATSETMKAVLSKQNTTATEVAAATARGSVRFGLIFRRYEKAMTELVWMIAKFNQEYMPPEKEFRIVGSDGQFKWDSIKDIEMAGKLDISIRAASVINEQAKVQKAMLMYDRLRQDPVIMGDIRSLYENTRYFMEAVGGRDINIDKQLAKPPQLMGRTVAEEHDLMNQKRMIVPYITDDHQRHLLEHTGTITQPEFQELDQEIQQLYHIHMEHHRNMQAAIIGMQQTGAYNMAGSPQAAPGMTQPAPAPGQGYVGGPSAGGNSAKKPEGRNKQSR